MSLARSDNMFLQHFEVDGSLFLFVFPNKSLKVMI